MPKQELIEKWESAIEAAKFYGKGKEERLIEYIRDFVDDLNQLDEAEVLSEEWLDENKCSWYKLKVDGYSIPVEKLQNLLVPKQEELDDYTKGWTDGIAAYVEDLHSGENLVVIEKPTIPQFVAEWIEDNKYKYGRGILKIGYDFYDSNLDNLDVDTWLQYNTEAFTRAWLDGFTVEEEQKYYVLDKTRNTAILVRMFDEPTLDPTPITEIDEVDQFTEQEIKNYDERYLAFKVPVEELEE